MPVVNPAGPDERGVELVDVVGGHEDDAAFRGRHAVDGVQQPGQRQTVQALKEITRNYTHFDEHEIAQNFYTVPL